jgi:hypothetical protein
MPKLKQARERREALFEHLTGPTTRPGHAHQHDLEPCVRRGAGERWLWKRGRLPKPSKAAALYFLRGNSAEDLIRDQNITKSMVIYGDPPVAISPDQWTGDPEIPFEEIKSTNLSSYPFYELDKRGSFSLDDPNLHGRNYFRQMAIYCVALGCTKAYLTIYFLHGDYADRRTKCPDCKNRLTDFLDDRVKVCPACGYKSKKGDIQTYLIEFDPEELAAIREEIFHIRAPMWYAAVEAETEREVCDLTKPSPNHLCLGCSIGKELGCEYYGTEGE